MLEVPVSFLTVVYILQFTYLVLFILAQKNTDKGLLVRAVRNQTSAEMKYLQRKYHKSLKEQRRLWGSAYFYGCSQVTQTRFFFQCWGLRRKNK